MLPMEQIFFLLCGLFCHFCFFSCQNNADQLQYVTQQCTVRTSILCEFIIYIIALSLNGNKNVFKKYDTRRCSLQKRMSSTYCGRMAHASDKQTFYLRLTIGAMGKIREQSTNRHNGYYDKVCIIIIIYFFRNQ